MALSALSGCPPVRFIESRPTFQTTFYVGCQWMATDHSGLQIGLTLCIIRRFWTLSDVTRSLIGDSPSARNVKIHLKYKNLVVHSIPYSHLTAHSEFGLRRQRHDSSRSSAASM